jgi:hypothetical protein
MRLAGPRACVVLALLALLSSPAVARAQGIATLPQGEFLFASPPEGWIVGHRSRQGNASIVEYVPAGQTVQSWTEMVTVQVWQGQQPSPDPKEFVLRIAGRFQRVCKKLQVAPPSERQIGGYDNVSLALECREPDRSQAPSQVLSRNIEFLAVRAIRGRDGFYVVQRAWHGDTEPAEAPMKSEATMKEWGVYLSRVEVCDTRDPALVCATLGLLSTPAADGFARRKGWAESGGCLYLRMLTVLPDMSKSIGGPVVVAAALGQGPLGKTGAVVETVNALARAVAENRPATVIANVSAAAATSPAEDAVKAEADVAALRDLLVERGIAPPRIVIRPNPSCQS